MESPSYEEENVLEDDERLTKLVDYPSSEDEDESQWLHGSASDTLLKAKCSSNLDAGEENMMEASGQSKTDCDYFFSDVECDDSDYEYETDREVLSLGPYSWRMADRSNRRENTMESPSYDEENVLEDDERLTKLVDYPCSSNLDAGENIDSPSYGMINVPDEEERIITDCPSSEDEEVKWWLCGSDSDTLLKGKCSSDLDSEEEDKMEAFGQSKPNFDDTFSDRVRDYCHYQTDDELLCFGPYSWRTEDTWNQREVYSITVYGEAPRKESRCLELLSAIGCEDRYLGCSVEMRRSFFANLNKNEADKMKGLEGVQGVIANRYCIFDV